MALLVCSEETRFQASRAMTDPSGYGIVPWRNASIAMLLPNFARMSLTGLPTVATEINDQSRYPGGSLPLDIAAAASPACPDVVAATTGIPMRPAGSTSATAMAPTTIQIRNRSDSFGELRDVIVTSSCRANIHAGNRGASTTAVRHLGTT